MFLEKSPEKLTRRTRIERWLLLALRCLALLALAMAFGRPFLNRAVLPAERATSSICTILVDRSASMQREDLATRAVAAAEKALSTWNTGDDVSLLFFDRSTRQVAAFEEWQNLDGSARASDFKKRILGQKNGWDRSDPGKALVEAADQIAARAGDREFRRREIVLISDFQQSASFDALNEVAWPENISITCLPVLPKKAGNLSVTLAAATDESRTAADPVYRVRVSNAAESESDRFELQWKGNPKSKISGVIPPGASRVLAVPAPKESGNETGELVLSGDAHPFDNTVYIAPPQPAPLKILFLSGEDDPNQVGSPFFYLKRALHNTASLSPEAEYGSFSELVSKGDDTAAIVMHGNWPVETGEAARALAESGKLIIALPTRDTQSEAFAALIDQDRTDLGLRENDDDKYAMLADLDFEHPVLAPFARARIRDFTKIRFWKFRRLTFPDGEIPDDIEVLAKFDSATPAWISRKLGPGAVFAFLSGWEPQESQFALSSKFVPVLYSIFENAGYSAKSAPAAYVGESEILDQNGKEETANRPGLFPVKDRDGNLTQRAVNLHPSEGRTDPVDPQHVLRELNIPLTDSTANGNPDPGQDDPATLKQIERAEKENLQKVWKWLVVAVLLLLFFETWLSGRRAGQAGAIRT